MATKKKTKKTRRTVSCSCETKVRVRVSTKRKTKAKSSTRTSSKAGMARGYAVGTNAARIRELEIAHAYYRDHGLRREAEMTRAALDAERSGKSTRQWALPRGHLNAMFESTLQGVPARASRSTKIGYAKGRSATTHKSKPARRSKTARSICRTAKGKFKKCS